MGKIHFKTFRERKSVSPKPNQEKDNILKNKYHSKKVTTDREKPKKIKDKKPLQKLLKKVE
jgi:hypothetical protein